MANISPLPLNTKFFGVFIAGAPPNGSPILAYEPWDFATNLKPQIDAVVALGSGVNSVSFFGDVNNYIAGTITVQQYIARSKVIFDYCAKVGLYMVKYGALTPSQWHNAAAPSTPSPTEISKACEVFAADAALFATYPNASAYVCFDEIWAANNTNATYVGIATDAYAAARSGVPSNFPVASAALPTAQNIALSVQAAYSGQGKTNLDTIINTLDVFAFHPQTVSAASDLTATLTPAFPSKKIIFPACVDQAADTNYAAITSSIFGLVGANNVVGAQIFSALDLGVVNTYGVFNSDYTNKTTRTNALKAGVSGTYPARTPRRFYGNPRLNQYSRWGYQ